MSDTLFDKIWNAHLVVEETPEHPAVLYIDRHLLHEVTSPQAFATLRSRGLGVRRPERSLATLWPASVGRRRRGRPAALPRGASSSDDAFRKSRVR